MTLQVRRGNRPVMESPQKPSKTKASWERWKNNACLNLLEWLEALRKERGFDSEAECERVLGFPQNTFNRLKNFSLPSPEKIQKIVEGAGIDWGTYGKILNQPRAGEPQLPDVEQRGEIEDPEQDEARVQQELIDRDRMLRFYVEQSNALQQEAQNEMRSPLYLAEFLIKKCIQVNNLTDDEIRKDLKQLYEMSHNPLFLWETFTSIRDGLRVFSDKTEALAFGILVDPDRRVVKLEEWEVVYFVDSMRFQHNNRDRN